MPQGHGVFPTDAKESDAIMDTSNPPGALIIDGTRCSSCIHQKVCHYRIERKRPGLTRRRVKAFGTVFTKVECEHYRGD